MMISIVSPAKKLDFETEIEIQGTHSPKFLEKSKVLIKRMKEFSSTEIGNLMKLSSTLSELNFKRYHSFKTPFTLKNSKPAIFAFKGDTYVGLNVDSFSKADLLYAEKSFRILSGLYGILSPLDLIQPYRLEMGTRFQINNETKNLYHFWKNSITVEIEKLLGSKNFLINLASNEYFSVVDTKNFEKRVVTPIFKIEKGGELKSVGMMSKRARGMMAAYIIKNKINDPLGLNYFNEDGYQYRASLSTLEGPVFTKKK